MGTEEMPTSKRADREPRDLVPNGNFDAGRVGGLPDAWEATGTPANAPLFKWTRKDGDRCLLAAGNGSDDCFGTVQAPVVLRAGRTYRFNVQFRISKQVDPQKNMRFSVYADNESHFNNGIFRFSRCKDGWVKGEERFAVPGKKNIPGHVRVGYCFNAGGQAWVKQVSLSECPPVTPRPVRVAATKGKVSLKEWCTVLDAAGKAKVDLILLPEMVNGEAVESMRGPTSQLMALKARQYEMYVAGGLYLRDRKKDRTYNTCLLFDRKGRLTGRYDKNHPYTPELWNDAGITPGRDVPVFKTDFGTVGILICYDSWFTDVTELLALKGAEIILFPNAGYFRSLMPARTADNCVRFVTSSLSCPLGIWDTAGRDITNPEADPTNGANVDPRATAHHIRKRKVGKVEMLIATLDLAQSPSPANWGGPCLSAPGGRRNRREQISLLQDQIKKETERWWEA